MRISVVVPTFKRLGALKRCLSALEHQLETPYEVIVVVRVEDGDAVNFVQGWSRDRRCYEKGYCVVREAGQVYALFMGTCLARGDIVAFTDDDAIPQRDWLKHMRAHYENSKVGGVGGRDVIIGESEVPLRMLVGRITWYGKHIGNHHLGAGGPREVDFLKGVNMSFRRELVSFSKYLKGDGAQTHNEMGMCLRIRRLGYSLVYDPSVAVWHNPAPRMDNNTRKQVKVTSVRNGAFNLQTSLLVWLPWKKKILRVLYSLLVGDSTNPGILRLLIGILAIDMPVIKSFIPTQWGCALSLCYYSQLLLRRTVQTVFNLPRPKPNVKGDA